MDQRTVVKTIGLKKWFSIRRGFSELFLGDKIYARAVDGISFEIARGEIFGLVGESGSGKTTAVRAMLMLTRPTDGTIFIDGKDVTRLDKKELRNIRRIAQIIFQDPYDSINPNRTISQIVSEPLRVHRLCRGKREIDNRVRKALSSVDLEPPEEFMKRYPHELSGGQRQRVAIARALVLEPQVVVADEPVSMLDVSIRAEILDLMKKLRRDTGLSILFITHDLAIAMYMCDRLAVMYLGKIVEMGATDLVVLRPLHPYTRALISAVPVPDPNHKRTEVELPGEIPSSLRIPAGCRFHPRCPLYQKRRNATCAETEPELKELQGRYVACHLAGPKE